KGGGSGALLRGAAAYRANRLMAAAISGAMGASNELTSAWPAASVTGRRGSLTASKSASFSSQYWRARSDCKAARSSATKSRNMLRGGGISWAGGLSGNDRYDLNNSVRKEARLQPSKMAWWKLTES